VPYLLCKKFAVNYKAKNAPAKGFKIVYLASAKNMTV